MLSFPSKAYIGRVMPKEAFYKRLTLNNEIREKFVSDIKRITIEYKLAPETINVEKEGEIFEILVLSIELKEQKIDYRIVENIARQNSHKLLFVLKYQDKGQLALYYNKLYKTQWMNCSDFRLDAKGFNLDSMWQGFIEQIALQEQIITEAANLTVDEKLKIQENILKLQKEIEKTEKMARGEKQPKKRFEIYTKLQNLKLKLTEEKGAGTWIN